MWPIWEWFVDADSYAVWADRSLASSRTTLSCNCRVHCSAQVIPKVLGVLDTSTESQERGGLTNGPHMSKSRASTSTQ